MIFAIAKKNYLSKTFEAAMTIVNRDNLPSKFHPYLLGHPSCPSNQLKDEIDQICAGSLTPLKGDYISMAGRWVFKLQRGDGIATTPDTHIYRIRKAEKIRNYILQNHLESHLMVPKKFLYWHQVSQKFYVISEKVNLSPEVAEPESDEVEDIWKAGAVLGGGQCAALAEDKPKRALTAQQAKALAELSTMGYTDLSYNNLYFTTDGRIAIIDTEPQKRFLKKAVAKNIIPYLLIDKSSLLAQQAISGTAKLKLYCSEEAARLEVRKVESKHALWNIAKLISKIALLGLALYFATNAIVLLPIAAVIATSLKVAVIAIAAIKMTYLTLNALYILMLLGLSQKHLEGIKIIETMERQGQF